MIRRIEHFNFSASAGEGAAPTHSGNRATNGRSPTHEGTMSHGFGLQSLLRIDRLQRADGATRLNRPRRLLKGWQPTQSQPHAGPAAGNRGRLGSFAERGQGRAA